MSKLVFLQKCYQFYVVLLLIILVYWFLIECSFYVFVFLILWCIFFLDLSPYLYFRSIQVLKTSILLCLLKFSILFSIPIRFPLFSWKCADCFGLLQFLWLLENYEILDLSSWECYKKSRNKKWVKIPSTKKKW